MSYYEGLRHRRPKMLGNRKKFKSICGLTLSMDTVIHTSGLERKECPRCTQRMIDFDDSRDPRFSFGRQGVTS